MMSKQEIDAALNRMDANAEALRCVTRALLDDLEKATQPVERIRPFSPAPFAGGLPTDAQERKAIPITTGVLDYFPDAIADVAACSKAGNEQHNPGQPLHWDKSKSTDHADCIARHLIQRGTIDTDGIRHSAKVAWRALALLQTEIEAGSKP